MNQQIKKLYEISQKENRLIVGLMSGTSLDGLDVALCRVFGNGKMTKIDCLQFETVEYDEDFKKKVRRVFAKETVDFPYLCLLNEYIGRFHAELVLNCLQKWEINTEDVDLIASHGQTVMHVPSHQHDIEDMKNGTLQISDGDQIAFNTGIITVSDFRQKHIAAGGEGAPLALYGDAILFGNSGRDRIMLNIGGIANFTFLPASGNKSELFVTDTGPGNTLLDAYCKKYLSTNFDKDSLLAKKGVLNEELLKLLKSQPFFNLPFPKTTGPEIFNLTFIEKTLKIPSDPQEINHFDVLATLTKFSADTISEGITKMINSSSIEIFLSGGGAHNPLLVSMLEANLPYCKFQKSDVLGVGVDAKEAILFALLANELVSGNLEKSLNHNSNFPNITMGKISFPH